MTDGSGEDTLTVTVQRRAAGSLEIPKDVLHELKDLVVLQDEGIIYCPIPKVKLWVDSCRRGTNDCLHQRRVGPPMTM